MPVALLVGGALLAAALGVQVQPVDEAGPEQRHRSVEDDVSGLQADVAWWPWPFKKHVNTNDEKAVPLGEVVITHAGSFKGEYLYASRDGDSYGARDVHTWKNGSPQDDPQALWNISKVDGNYFITHAGSFKDEYLFASQSVGSRGGYPVHTWRMKDWVKGAMQADPKARWNIAKVGENFVIANAGSWSYKDDEYLCATQDDSNGWRFVHALMNTTADDPRALWTITPVAKKKAPRVVAAAGTEAARLEELAWLEDIPKLQEEIARLEENTSADVQECAELTYFIQYGADYNSKGKQEHVLTFTGPAGITWDSFDTCVDQTAAAGTAAESTANHCKDKYDMTVRVLRRTDKAGNSEIVGAGTCCNIENLITATTQLCVVHYSQPPTPATTLATDVHTDAGTDAGAAAPAPTTATFYVGYLGAECANNEHISSRQECEQALHQVGQGVATSHWEGYLSKIPRGCSYKTSSQEMHFNHAGVGHGRGDLQPICRVTTEAQKLSTAAPRSPAA